MTPEPGDVIATWCDHRPDNPVPLMRIEQRRPEMHVKFPRAGWMHLELSVAPSSAVAPPQEMQLFSLVAPIALLYRPVAHGWQLLLDEA